MKPRAAEVGLGKFLQRLLLDRRPPHGPQRSLPVDDGPATPREPWVPESVPASSLACIFLSFSRLGKLLGLKIAAAKPGCRMLGYPKYGRPGAPCRAYPFAASSHVRVISAHWLRVPVRTRGRSGRAQTLHRIDSLAGPAEESGVYSHLVGLWEVPTAWCAIQWCCPRARLAIAAAVDEVVLRM